MPAAGGMRRPQALCALVLLTLLTLVGCTRLAPCEVVVRDESGYAEALRSDGLVIGTHANLSPWRALGSGRAVEAASYQAVPALDRGLAAAWYPHYLVTPVIAVDRSRTAASPTTWAELRELRDPLSISLRGDGALVLTTLAAAVAPDRPTADAVADLLRPVADAGLLRFDDPDAAVLVCLDSEAAALIGQGRPLEVVVPRDGSLTVTRGLLAPAPLVLPPVSDALLAAGYRLPDGTADPSRYPADYAAARTFDQADALASVAPDLVGSVRRELLGEVRLASNGEEHLLVAAAFAVLVVAWSGSTILRISSRPLAQAIAVNGALLVGWVLVRAVKYQMVETTTNLLWYSYYFFMLALPLVLLWTTLAVTSDDGDATPAAWWRQAAISLAAFVLVATNDLHEQVFDLLPDGSYRYGWGYGAASAAMLAPLVWSLVVLVRARRTLRNPGALVGPLLATGAVVGYPLAYAAGVPPFAASDLTITFGLLTVVFYDVALRSGLIPHSARHRLLFSASTLRLQLLDAQGRRVAAAPGAPDVTDAGLAALRRDGRTPDPDEPDVTLIANPIAGGMVVWRHDPRPVRDLQDSLTATNARLEATVRTLAHRHEVEERRARLATRSELLADIGRIVASSLAQATALLRQSDGDADVRATRLSLLLFAAKRRCAVHLLAHQTDTLDAAVVVAQLRELAGIAGRAGVRAHVRATSEAPVPLDAASQFYTFTEECLADAVATPGGPLLFDVVADAAGPGIRLLHRDTTPFVPSPRFAAAITARGGTLTHADALAGTSVALTFPSAGDRDE